MAQIFLIDVQFVSLLTQEKVCVSTHLFHLDVEFASLIMQERVCDNTDFSN